MNTEVLRALLAEATPGPWASLIDDYERGTLFVGRADQSADGWFIASSTRNADAEVIVAAVNALPALLDVVEIVRRHTHQGMLAMTYHAGPAPEEDCRLCRALVAAGVLTLDGIGSGTRAAIESDRDALDRLEAPGG